MTDKEIIIDDCDVRKCVNRQWDNSQKTHLCYAGNSPLTPWSWCEENPNCYFKQLKRKEQECEELKNEYWKLEQGNDFLAEKNSRLKGCFAEIKEIAEPFCNACQEFEPEKKGSNCMYCNYGIILRKISEVEK